MSSLYGIQELISALDSQDAAFEKNAMTELREHGPATIDPLLSAVRDRSIHAYWKAASLVAELDDARCFAALCEWLVSSDPMLGDIAARALAEHGKVGQQTLIDHLHLCHVIVQLTAVSVLETHQVCAAVPEMMGLLCTTRSSTLRHMLIQALGTLGDERAVPTIRLYINDADHHMRKRARRALRQLTGTSLSEDVTSGCVGAGIVGGNDAQETA